MVSRRVSTRRIASAPKKNSLLYLLSSGDCAPTLFIRIGKALGVNSSLPPTGRVFIRTCSILNSHLSPGPPQYSSYLRPPKNAARLGDHELAHRPLAVVTLRAALGDAPHAVSHVDVLHLPPHLKKGAKGPKFCSRDNTSLLRSTQRDRSLPCSWISIIVYTRRQKSAGKSWFKENKRSFHLYSLSRMKVSCSHLFERHRTNLANCSDEVEADSNI